MQKIILVAGARPNFVKIAPLWRAFSKYENVETVLVHTGQHYDDTMSRVFFEDLGLPQPQYNLDVRSGTHAKQTAAIMSGFDDVIAQVNPDDVVVTGDVNSTFACAIVAVKLGVRTSHIEAGLRSFDRSMPEEINRIATDAISDLLFVSEKSGMQNLKKEGVADEKVHFVGNVMIDSMAFAQPSIENSGVLTDLELENQVYALVTIHRPSNVDDFERFKNVVDWLFELSRQITLIFPMHPRSLSQFNKLMKEKAPHSDPGSRLRIIPPQRYVDFQRLLKSAKFVITDSGGLQEESTWLGVPCVTLRKNTERPVTIEKGTNILAGENLVMANNAVQDCLNRKVHTGELPDLWDGLAARRIAKILVRR
ncbi:non-hydrolyzing UDP-N-acetylglucosamine 2-epimerase [Marinilabilia rubra]|uniref:UDP-N-acetylglucosamine 2-epimerase (Non-hydrolyzing) n=1 Tax=Marinilabilia rubra TaxID=2162893 RepID=A0A2U2B4M2_9BACT|nr:UDP-N-acetylglucosamine 2-epimerase (non-hydrolyzing) [Marinilabilia rubra]PWD97984.1 UDP-N-acetylglucosamine 2-epimerase (non-hydrolyzing) [Marinilabilia rubra]